MKSIISSFFALFLLLAAACSEAGRDYDSALCESLAVKVERHDSITQKDYRQMIEQSEQILGYLVGRSEHLIEMPADERYQAYRELLADPQYMERFSYLFTLGSALYDAEVTGCLDNKNREAYDKLDEYNERFSAISDRL